MPYLKFPQFSSNSLRAQVNNTSSVHPQGGVVQEKVSLTRDLKASERPAPGSKVVRPPEADTTTTRAQHHTTRKRRKVPFTLHIDPIDKADVAEQARLDGISASREGADLMVEMLHQKIHQRKAATLGSVLEEIIDRKFSQRDNRLASLLIHNLLTTERILGLVTQLLNRTPGMTSKVLEEILDKSLHAARRKVAKRNPQLTAIIQELKEIILAADEEEEGHKTPSP